MDYKILSFIQVELGKVFTYRNIAWKKVDSNRAQRLDTHYEEVFKDDTKVFVHDDFSKLYS